MAAAASAAGVGIQLPVSVTEGDVTPIRRSRVRGSYPEIHDLMRRVERMDRLTRIDRFEARADEDNPTQVSAKVELSLFFLAS